MDRMIIVVGKKHPIPTEIEGPRAFVSTGTLGVHLFYENLLNYEVEAFRLGRIRYGVISFHNAPFFLTEIQGFGDFDCSINIAAESEDVREEFLSSNANLVTLVLSSFPDCIVQGLRAFAVSEQSMLSLKNTCRQQTDEHAVNAKIKHVYSMFTTEELINQAEMKYLF